MWTEVIEEINEPAFHPASEDRGFISGQASELMDDFLPQGSELSEIDPETLIDLLRAQIALRKSDNDLIFPVKRKGVSLLQEMELRNVVQQEETLAEESMKDTNLEGKSILVVEDSVHTGKSFSDKARQLRDHGATQITLVTVIASEEGLASIREEFNHVQAFPLVRIPEENFSLYASSLLGKLLETLRSGTIPDWPSTAYRIASPNFNSKEFAKDSLKAISRCPQVNRLEEMDPQGRERPPVFHGTIHPPDSFRADIETRLKAGEIFQLKLRVYVDPRPPAIISLWSVIDGRIPNAKGQSLEDTLEGLAIPVLEPYCEWIEESLLERDYSVTEIPINSSIQ